MSSFFINSKKMLLLISITSQLHWVHPQDEIDRIHKNQCAAFKDEAFAKVYNISPLVAGMEDFKIVVDKCPMLPPFIKKSSPALAKEFPHVARLGIAQEDPTEVKWICCGTLISKKFVLTAANCFYSPDGILNRVRLGELVFNSDTDDARPEDFDVLRTIKYPDYREAQAYNDIGLVELQRPVTLSEYIIPACLPSDTGDDFDRFYAVGWGATIFAGPTSDALLKVQLDRVSGERCRQFTNGSDDFQRGLNENKQLCAKSTGPEDICHGSAGGPLLQMHSEHSCMQTIYGIISYGLECGVPDVPVIYTRVYYYLDWIEAIVW